ncbi:MAG: hypothetical protein M0P09_02575 [Acholeplasmataceae bacterium]|nr:hypothetical protein [Acholeplasmataceae bacterium]
MARKKVIRRKHANKWQADRARREQNNQRLLRTHKSVTFRLHIENDADILAFFEQLPNKVDFMRELIRKEIEASKK